MGDVKIQDAEATDAAALEAMVRRAFEPYALLIGRDPAPMHTDWSAGIEAGQVRLAEARGDLAGVVLGWEEDGAHYIDVIAVAPAHAGQGVGRALIADAERRAREAGCARLHLHTNAAMEGARRFYPALGFIETDRREVDGYDRVFFEKPLV